MGLELSIMTLIYLISTVGSWGGGALSEARGDIYKHFQ